MDRPVQLTHRSSSFTKQAVVPFRISFVCCCSRVPPELLGVPLRVLASRLVLFLWNFKIAVSRCGGPQGAAVEPSAGGQGTAGHGLLAHEARWSSPGDPSIAVRFRRVLILHQPPGRHRRRHPPGCRGRPAAARREPQRLQGRGRIRGQSIRRQDPHDRRRRLPGHWTGQSAPSAARPERTSGLEGGTQQVPQQAGPSPRRARLAGGWVVLEPAAGGGGGVGPVFVGVRR